MFQYVLYILQHIFLKRSVNNCCVLQIFMSTLWAQFRCICPLWERGIERIYHHIIYHQHVHFYISESWVLLNAFCLLCLFGRLDNDLCVYLCPRSCICMCGCLCLSELAHLSHLFSPLRLINSPNTPCPHQALGLWLWLYLSGLSVDQTITKLVHHFL